MIDGYLTSLETASALILQCSALYIDWMTQQLYVEKELLWVKLDLSEAVVREEDAIFWNRIYHNVYTHQEIEVAVDRRRWPRRHQ